MTRRAVRSKLLQRLSDSKENATNVEKSGTRPPIVDQEELAERDTMIITIMRMREMVAGRMATLITSIYTRRTIVLLQKERTYRQVLQGQITRKNWSE